MSKGKTPVSLADVASADRPSSPTSKPAGVRATAGSGRRGPAGVARTTPREQIGLYIHEATMQDVRSAYLADFHSRGESAPNSLDAWIGEAVRELAALRPEARAKRLDALPAEPATVVDPATGEERPAVRKGGKVRLSEDTAARMDIACSEDEEARYASRGRNTFIAAAMRYGVARARRLHEERTGDTELPPAPPGRLTRRGASRI